MNKVYLITNTVNGKQYVGITCRGYRTRFLEHIHDSNYNKDNQILHSAIRKYGPDKFIVELLESNIPDELADSKEKEYISKYKTYYAVGQGYNMTEGGGGVVGYKHSEESKLKISESLKGIVFSQSRNDRISKALKNRPKSLEHRKHLSDARIGRYTKQDNPFYGKHHTNETKKAISDAKSNHIVFQIDMDTGKVIRTFPNLNLAGLWVVDAGLSKALYTTCAVRIGEVCRNPNPNCKAYGFHWAIEEGQSTNK